jgi:hypothetical protein
MHHYYRYYWLTMVMIVMKLIEEHNIDSQLTNQPMIQPNITHE